MSDTKPIEAKKDIKPSPLPEPVAPAKADDKIAAQLAQLEEAIKKTNALNASIEAKEKELDEKLKDMKPMAALPEQQKQHVIQAHSSKAAAMKENLKNQPKVKIFVPLEGKEKKGTQLPVTLNGYRVNVPKGMYVEVPEQVGQLIMESLNQTQEATDIPQNLDNMEDDKRAKIFG